MVTPSGVAPATVVMRDGRIDALIGHGEELGAGVVVHDVGELAVMAGLVDTHVHVNEPGRTEWEGFESATRAAAAGGITTLVDMPLNSIPPTTTVEALAAKRAAAEGHVHVDVGFWGGVVPGHDEHVQPLLDAGVLGFKSFLIESGVEEFGPVDAGVLLAVLPLLAEAQRPLLVHAELPGPIAEAAAGLPPEGSPEHRHYRTWLAARPRRAEDEAVALLVQLTRETGAPLHVVHHASSDSLELIARSRDEGLSLTAETCPHYLHFAAEDVPDGATAFKCAPPLREAENRELLWAGLSSGVLDAVVSDHSPCAPHLKGLEAGDFTAAWGGIAGLQLGLPTTWSGARARGLDLPRISTWMSAAPARLAGLTRKGRIAPGYDADLVIWDPEASFTVVPERLHHRHPVTPYAGEVLHGVVRETWLAGVRIALDGDPVGAPRGRLLSAGDR